MKLIFIHIIIIKLCSILKSSNYLVKGPKSFKIGHKKELNEGSKHQNRPNKPIFKKWLCDVVMSFNNC
jgi:hypothetical protein